MFTQYQYSPPPNTKHWHNFGRQYRLLKNAFYELISYDCKSTEKKYSHFFVLSLCGHIVDHTKRFGALTHGSWGSQLKKMASWRHNHAFSLYAPAVKIEKTIFQVKYILNTFLLYWLHPRTWPPDPGAVNFIIILIDHNTFSLSPTLLEVKKI